MKNLKLLTSLTVLSFTLMTICTLFAEKVSWDKPPSPRPKDPRLELQPIFDSNGVVYEWKGYIANPVSSEKQEIQIDDSERTYRVSDSNNENIWTISLQNYNQTDRLEPMPRGLRVCLKDVKHPPGTDKPHFESDISGQITVAMTLDCPTFNPPISFIDPKRIGGSNLSLSLMPRKYDSKTIGSSKIIQKPDDCANCIFIENNAFTHPDRALGPDVASHSDRTLFAYRETINQIRIYQDPLDPTQGTPNGFAFAWQGARTNPALSVLRNRHDPDGVYGVVFTIPRGFVHPNIDGTIKRSGGLTALLRGDERNNQERRREDDPRRTPPPATP